MNKILKINNYLVSLVEMNSFKFYRLKLQNNYKIKVENF